MTTAARHDETFVSVGIIVWIPPRDAIGPVRDLAMAISARFKYWELVLLTLEDIDSDEEALLLGIPNVRLLKVRVGTPHYLSRAALAEEAIGDVVALASIDELSSLDLPAMIEKSIVTGSVIATRRKSHSVTAQPVQALGRAAGFRVSGDDLLTVIYPRTHLNRLLAHPDRQLALRFAPVDTSVPVVYETVALPVRDRTLRDLWQRLGTAQRLLLHSAPMVLSFVALLSLFVTLCALSYALYAVGVWIVQESIQPGWLTTSLALSGTATFLGIAITGLAIGIQRLLEALNSEPPKVVTSERSGADLFAKAMRELNVELDSGHAPETRGRPDGSP